MSNPPLVQVLAAKHYVDKGLSDNAAIALASVFYYESKLNPNSQGSQSTETPGVLNPHGAYGIMSLNGPRQGDYKKYADARGITPYNQLEPQLDFALNDIANRYPRSWAAIQSNDAINTIIDVLVREYENPADPAREIAGAIEISGRLIAVLGSYTRTPPPPVVPAPVPLPPPAPAPAPVPGTPPVAPAPQLGGWRAEAIATLTALSNDCNAEIKVLNDVNDMFGVAIATLSGGSSTMTTAPTQAAAPAWLVNWKTTLSGIITAAAQIAKVIPQLQPYSALLDSLSGIAAGFGLMSAKDSNVTGGTKSNVTGITGAPVSLVDLKK